MKERTKNFKTTAAKFKGANVEEDQWLKKMMSGMVSGRAMYIYLNDLISKDFITLLFFCWDKGQV